MKLGTLEVGQESTGNHRGAFQDSRAPVIRELSAAKQADADGSNIRMVA